jgi:hypothetical protein
VIVEVEGEGGWVLEEEGKRESRREREVGRGKGIFKCMHI